MHIDGVEPTELAYMTSVKVNVFTKKVENEAINYDTAIELHAYLKRRKYDVDIELNTNVKCEFCYFITLTVNLKTYPTC
jgi:hypothetical protein